MKNNRCSIPFPVTLLIVLIMTVGCGPGTAQERDTRDGTQFRDNDGFTRVDELGFDDESRQSRQPVVKSDYRESRQRNDYNNRREAPNDTRFDNRNDRRVYAGSKRDRQVSSQDNVYQKGKASWYGREFHGKVTASGDRFSMYEYTAAHKTLPFGSYIEVTNLRNGKTVTVRVNDRGPYRGNRVIDLSFTAAKQLDMLRDGEVPVKIVVLKKGSGERNFQASRRNTSVEPVVDDKSYGQKEDFRQYGGASGNVVLQAGAFFSRRNAENLKSRISGMTSRQVIVVSDGDLYKVRVKGLSSRGEAEGLKRKLADSDINSFIAE